MSSGDEKQQALDILSNYKKEFNEASQVKLQANLFKNEGNKMFQQQEFFHAIDFYSKAIAIYPDHI